MMTDTETSPQIDPRTTLEEIVRVQERSRSLREYAEGAPHLVIWGAVWMVCNLAAWLMPELGGQIWMAGIALGVLGSFAAGWHAHRERHDRRVALRWAATMVAVFAGMTALLWILNPTDPRQIDAAFSLAVATAYVLLGIWRGGRFLMLGAVIALAVVLAWGWFRSFFFLWMGIVGGGALILGGWWLREEK